MKTFKILFSVLVIGLMALQPISSVMAVDDFGCGEPYILYGGHGDYIRHAKNKFFGGCKYKCYHICNPKKRDINLELSLVKLSMPKPN